MALSDLLTVTNGRAVNTAPTYAQKLMDAGILRADGTYAPGYEWMVNAGGGANQGGGLAPEVASQLQQLYGQYQSRPTDYESLLRAYHGNALQVNDGQYVGRKEFLVNGEAPTLPSPYGGLGGGGDTPWQTSADQILQQLGTPEGWLDAAGNTRVNSGADKLADTGGYLPMTRFDQVDIGGNVNGDNASRWNAMTPQQRAQWANPDGTLIPGAENPFGVDIWNSGSQWNGGIGLGKADQDGWLDKYGGLLAIGLPLGLGMLGPGGLFAGGAEAGMSGALDAELGAYFGGGDIVSGSSGASTLFGSADTLGGLPAATPPVPTFDPSLYPSFESMGGVGGSYGGVTLPPGLTSAFTGGGGGGPAGLPPATPPTPTFNPSNYPTFESMGGVGGSYPNAFWSTSLGKFLTGQGEASDYLRLAGGIGSGLLGAAGASNAEDRLSRLSSDYLNMGAPFRAKLMESYSPSFDLAKSDPQFQNAIDTSANSVLKKLSATTGNPFDNPGALMEANRYVTGNTYLPQLNTYRSQLGGFGQLGVNQAGTAGLGAAQASGGMYDALGYGLGQLTNQNDLQSLLRQINQMGGGFKLGTGNTFSG